MSDYKDYPKLSDYFKLIDIADIFCLCSEVLKHNENNVYAEKATKIMQKAAEYSEEYFEASKSFIEYLHKEKNK